MEDCKPTYSPCDPTRKLIAEADQQRTSDVPYREAVGSLLFLVQGTRPDLAFAVSNVSRFNDKYNDSHWVAVKRILRYVKATVGYRLVYRRRSVGAIHGFVDADWANETNERRSFSGYTFLMAGAAVVSSGRASVKQQLLHRVLKQNTSQCRLQQKRHCGWCESFGSSTICNPSSSNATIKARWSSQAVKDSAHAPNTSMLHITSTDNM